MNQVGYKDNQLDMNLDGYKDNLLDMNLDGFKDNQLDMNNKVGFKVGKLKLLKVLK